MNIKYKSKLCILLLIACLFVSASSISAMELSETSPCNANDHFESISPLMMCPYCNVYAQMRCLKNQRIGYTAIHTSTCKITVYVSNTANVCLACGKWQEYYAAHDCIEVHSTCSKGTRKVCNIGVYWPN